MTTGGSDSVTLAIGNIPAHSHTFSANTSAFDYGSKQTTGFDYGWKQTDVQGEHTHPVPSSDGANQGGKIPLTSGRFEIQNLSSSTGAAGAHAHNLYIGAHDHWVGIGAHSHSVSGTTASIGSDSAFSIANSFIKLMGWYRSA